MKARLERDRSVVCVATRGGPFAGVTRAVILRRAQKMVRHLGLKDVELSVAIVNDEAIRALNKTFRHKDKPTDVLAFPAGDGVEAEGLVLLGDVILSVETARRQASKHRRPLLAELTMLLAHGLLHLVGMDHHTDPEERAMKVRTRELEAAAARPKPRATKPPRPQKHP